MTSSSLARKCRKKRRAAFPACGCAARSAPRRYLELEDHCLHLGIEQDQVTHRHCTFAPVRLDPTYGPSARTGLTSTPSTVTCSSLRLTSRLTDDEGARLAAALRESGDKFSEHVTAFRPEMAVHGRFREPCPVCGTPVQRIRYVENETDYCPTCQTDGRLLADRGMSRLLKKDWPRSLEEMDERLGR